jgi:hypothetical protein
MAKMKDKLLNNSKPKNLCANIKNPTERKKCEDRQKQSKPVKARSDKDKQRASAYDAAGRKKKKGKSFGSNVKKALTGTIWNLD